MNRKIDLIWLIVGLIIGFALLKQCKGEPEIITKTEIKTVTDTITTVKIKEVPKPVYVEKIKTVKGKDSIIYKDKPSETTINAKEYETELLSNEAKADLQIIVDGELLDVKGTIQYPEKTTTIIKKRDNSGFYIFSKLPIDNVSSPELGVLFQIKNKMFISTSAQYNNFSRKIDYKVGIGVKL